MGVQSLPKKTQNALDDFVGSLRDIYGEDLMSVLLYGSASSGEYSGRYSNVNVAVILRDADIHNLAKARPAITKNKFRTINPVFFDEAYIKRSTDVFPMEFLDMKESHVILYGRDILKDISVDMKNLRFQCEQELKSKLINIKRAFLANPDRAFFERVLFRFFTSCLHILRNIIRVRTGRVVYPKEDIIRETAREFQIGEANFMTIWNAKRKGAKLDPKRCREIFLLLVEDIEKISNAVDAM